MDIERHPGGAPTWDDPQWLGAAKSWFRRQGQAVGQPIQGRIEQSHTRPWSTVLRAQGLEDDLYMKCVAPHLRFEVPLLEKLASEHPHLLPVVLAADPGRGWMLLAPAGQRLREQLGAAPDLRHWRRLLPMYAQMQRDLMGSASELLALGLPDRRLETFPQRLARMLSDESLLRLGQEDGLTSNQQTRLRDLMPKLARRSELLDAFPIRASLDHGDIHDANIFLREVGFAIVDWGDAGLTHPFFSLRTVFVSVETTLGLEEEDDAFEVLRNDYLKPWSADLPLKELVRIFDLARQLWSLVGAFRWQLAISDLDPKSRQPYRHAVPALLTEFLAAVDGP